MTYLIIILFAVLIMSLVLSYFFLKESKAEIDQSKQAKRSENERIGVKQQSHKVLTLGIVLLVFSVLVLIGIIWILIAM
ncbi:hypothetical protein [Staphylococcus parequorum]|uniref:hypothetical protein n=1 Tax=Staphylococcus sp. S9 TaxID=3135640 RepID=UPI003D08CB49